MPFMVEPPCVTFSLAQYPPSPSFLEPRGFVSTENKILDGATMALRSLALIEKGAQVEAPGLREQPRKTKMRRLDEWQFLVNGYGCQEEWTASCAYSSPRLKEFVFLMCHLPRGLLHRKCSKDHTHIKIQGVYAIASATYVDGLAEAIAIVFHKALVRKCPRRPVDDDMPPGLESPFVNDVLLSSKWPPVSFWRWKAP